MKYTKTLIIPIISLLLVNSFSLSGQTYFSQDFESGVTPLNWSNQFIEGSTPWKYAYGGYRTVDTLPNSGNPPATPDGSDYNALFQVQEIGNSTMLVTAPINLQLAIKPELRFYHAQYAWYHGYYGIDKLSVYYKNHVDSAWVLLKEYPNEVNSWVQRKILLPDSTLSGTYYLGFKATSNWGYGVCIDNIQIVETGIQPRAIESVKFSQPYTQPVPSGTSNNPLLMMKVLVSGNTGKMVFDSLQLKSLGTNDNDIAENGLHLYSTQDSIFNTTNYIGDIDSIKNHYAYFSNLNLNLESGTTYLWVAVDADSSAGHNDILDVSVEAGKMHFHLDTTGIMNTTGIQGVESDSIVYTKDTQTLKAPLYYNLPTVNTSPTGKRVVREAIFVDDFETDKGWQLIGEFQIDTARGLGGKAGFGKGNPDPTSAVSGSRVLGTDLSGLGTYPGNYEILDPNNPGDTVLLYEAISPPFDLRFYNDVKISFYKYLNAESVDHAGIDISVDGDTTWQNIYNKPGLYYSNSWILDSMDISEYASRHRDVRIRFTLGPTDDLGQYSGWNIDDFVVTANYLTSDLGVTEILAPVNGCGHTGSETVQVRVKNYSALPVDTIPISISLNGGVSFIKDTVYQTIKSDSSAVLTLNKTVDLTSPGIYNFVATTSAFKDEDHSNDTVAVKLYIQPTLTLSSEENFESSSGIWIPWGKNSTWEWGRSYQGDYPPPSGTKVWRTGLDKNYKSLDSSFIESPCYNFNDTSRYLLQVYHWNSTESMKDGAKIQYSLNNGVTWNSLDTNEFGWNWNWYTDSVAALDGPGWTGNSSVWKKSRQLLPSSLRNNNMVKFRVEFASDSTNTGSGISIDNFAIYPAPPDLGIASIDAPVTDCQFVNSGSVKVSVKNFGLNVVKAQDSVVIGMEFNGEAPYFDTLAFTSDLSPGDSTQFTLGKLVNIDASGTYNITAYTIGEEIPSLYSTNNDTARATFVILPNPYTNLLDTIQTKEPDTVRLVPYYDPGYSYLWQPGDSTGSVYHTAKDGWYYLTVTDVGGNGCSSVDSSYVELLFNDAGIDSLLSPVTSCMLGTDEYLTVQVKNYGTDSIVAGENIVVAYELDGGAPVFDTLTLGSTFYSGHVLPYTFKHGPLDLTSPGSYHFKLYSDFGGDTIPENDTTYATLQVYGYPTVSVGQDTIVKALSYTLDAGSGFESYLWNNGDTTQTHIVTTPGYHKVTVVDNNNCPASDSAYVWLKIRDISPTLLVNPVSTCDLNSGVQVKLQVTNTGNDTIPASTNIDVKYKLNQNTLVSEAFSPGADILPGNKYTYTFSHSEDMTTPDNYDFLLTATTNGDLRTTNDTIDSTVYVYPRPQVQFPPDNILKVYALSDTLDAGYGANYTYLWQDGATSQKYVASESNFYHVTVTDSYTGCYDRDTIFLQFIITDIGVTGITMDTVLCPGTYNGVGVDISNLGNGSMGVGTKFYLSYQDKKDTITLQNVLVAGAKLTHTLTKPLNFTETETQQLEVSTVFNSDLRHENDAKSIKVRVVPGPEVDFGTSEDTIRSTLPYTLNAGNGYDSYLWEDGSTGSTYNVTTPGYYKVTVTGGEAGCETTAGIYVDQETYVRNLTDDNIDISVYPVPATTELTIDMKSEPGDMPFTIEVLSNTGQIMYTEKIQQGEDYYRSLDISDYKSGIYFIRIYNKDYLHISKVIKY